MDSPPTNHEGAPEHGGAHHDAPLLDLDGTIFIQLGLFLFMIVMLRTLVFKPWLALRAEREDRIGGEKRRATELDQKATEILTDYEARIARARQIGNDERQKRRLEAQAQERQMVGQAREQSEQAIAAQTEAMKKQREEARIKLVAGAQGIGRAVATKILGRELG
jgi:F-type H+-transporting ATPase subunit b